MSYLTQMAGLAYHNFASAGGRHCVGYRGDRGHCPEETDKLGNFWVERRAALLWVLLPICVAGSLVFVSQGCRPEPETYTTVQLLSPRTVR